MVDDRENVEGRFFVIGSLSGDEASLSKEEAAHAVRSRRLTTGDLVEIINGCGTSRRGRLETGGRGGSVQVRFTEPARIHEASNHRLTVAVSPPKGSRMTLLVEKLSELGVDALVPTVFRRSLDAGVRTATAKVDRWRRTAIEAAKQCRRYTLLDVEKPQSLSSLLSSIDLFDLKILFRSLGDPAPLYTVIEDLDPPPEETLFLVGPEGGFTPEEAERIKDIGFIPASLGSRILRIETAAMAAAALFRSRWP